MEAPGTVTNKGNTVMNDTVAVVQDESLFGEELKFLVPRAACMFQSVTMTHIYQDVILEQHTNAFNRKKSTNGLASILSPDLNPIEHVWDMLGRRIAARQPLPPVYRNFGHCLMID
ncbi:hypothetical protein AVEN_126850-1 [Araneus ventricosus]|uniref:Tc1-like transposase DDE domain-containing protein n=1 Tax=Araneus ventricosus TaxID=182803 RepID=A0A4Y2WHY3_ARAVE|nr:hypothetical protein AVEN_126850-1 [Araneus ventricosus]